MGYCRKGQNGIFFPNYFIFGCSFLAWCLGFECRGFPCVLECGFLEIFLWSFGVFLFVCFVGFVGWLRFFPHVLISACAKNLGSNAF